MAAAPIRWTDNQDHYLKLFADCIPVKGTAKSAIYDLTRHEITTFSSEYFELLVSLNGRRISSIFSDTIPDDEKDKILAVLNFLHEHEMMMLTKSPEQYPAVPESWDYPGTIQNAVLDVSEKLHDFGELLSDLDQLGCQQVQIRGFTPRLSLSVCEEILRAAEDTSIAGLEFILHYDPEVQESTYFAFMQQHPLTLSITLHSAPESRRLNIQNNPASNYDGSPTVELRYTSQIIDSEKHCGRISTRQFTPPSMASFFEAKIANSCLNRKIAVDASGQIRNCPSMPTSVGNAMEVRLIDAVKRPELKTFWGTNKGQVEICKDCEYRYACSDCRAYLEHPDNLLSKPLRCGYSPYTGVWEDWTQNPVKQQAARLYQIAI